MGANTKRFAMWRERKSVTLFAWKSEQKSSILSFLEGGQEVLESRLRRYDHKYIRFMRSALAHTFCLSARARKLFHLYKHPISQGKYSP